MMLETVTVPARTPCCTPAMDTAGVIWIFSTGVVEPLMLPIGLNKMFWAALWETVMLLLELSITK